VLGRGILLFGLERADANEAPRDGVSAGEPACETRDSIGRLGAVPARDAGRAGAVERRLEEDVVGMLYLAAPPALGCGLDGVMFSVAGGGTTTQFFASSSFWVLFLLTCLRLLGLASGVGR